MTLYDRPDGYGPVSRALHWGMAALFLWQFAGPVLWVTLGDTPLAAPFNATHVPVGIALLLLVVLRGVWGLLNLGRRPPREGPRALRRLAALGHGALYALMVLVPGTAVVRAAASEWGLAAFGIVFVPPGGASVPGLMAPGNLLHGPGAWTLLVLALGHAGLALWHGLVRRDGTLRRMSGGPPRPRDAERGRRRYSSDAA